MIGMFKRRYKNEKLMGFVFGGSSDIDYVRDVNSYDYENDTWYVKLDIMNSGQYLKMIGTTIFNKGYIVYNITYAYFEEFDPIFSIWAEKTRPNNCYSSASMFTINSKAYLVQGYSSDENNEYDQILDLWTIKEIMPFNNRLNSAAITINGKGYLIGGVSPVHSIDEVNEYTQETDSWVNMTNLPEAKAYASAQTVNNKGYLFSGNNGNETFEYVNDTWSIKSDHPLPTRTQMASSKSTNGNCCIHGGGNSSGELSDNDKYTVGSDTWEEKTDMPLPSRKMVLGISMDVISGIVYSDIMKKGGYIFGGKGDNCNNYMPSIDTWCGRMKMLQATNRTTATTINDKAYVFGGNRNRQDCDEYSSEDDQWTMKSDMPLPARNYMASSTINNKGYVYCGGISTYVYTQDCDEYDPINNTWEEKTDAPNPARNRLTGFTINSKGYACCGHNSLNSRDCDEYDPDPNTWLSKSNYPLPKVHDTSSSVIYNKGYIYSGYRWDLACNEYNPDTNGWTNKADVICDNTTKYMHASSTIDNKGYVYGGYSYPQGSLKECIEYNSITDTWAEKANMMIKISSLSATTLSN